MSPVCSATGMNSVGEMEPRVGWFQRAKRFDGIHVSGDDVEDRLIIHLELIAPYRFAQIDFQRAPPVGFGLHLIRIDLEAVAPIALRSIERKIGIAQDLVDALTMGGNQGDPDAAADDDRVAVDLIRRADRLDQPRSQNSRAVQQIAVCGLCNNRKLVATETRRDVGFATRGLDPSGHALEKLVSSLMPQGIVDGLEPVEVEKKNREFRAETPMPRERCVEPLLEQVAVREPRQSVKMGQLLDADLGVLSIRNVFVRRNPTPVRHRVVGDSDRPAVGEHKLRRKNLLARQSFCAPGRVAIGLFLDNSNCDKIG
jgi:hypothetical protein